MRKVVLAIVCSFGFVGVLAGPSSARAAPAYLATDGSCVVSDALFTGGLFTSTVTRKDTTQGTTQVTCAFDVSENGFSVDVSKNDGFLCVVPLPDGEAYTNTTSLAYGPDGQVLLTCEYMAN